MSDKRQDEEVKRTALSLLAGFVAGLRTFTAPAAVSWAIRSGRLPLQDKRLSLLGRTAVSDAFLVLAIGEMTIDLLPHLPSRKTPSQFGARLASGGLSGAVLGGVSGSLAGVTGAAAGTLSGHAARRLLARALGRDVPAALIEDAAAIMGAFLILRAPR